MDFGDYETAFRNGRYSGQIDVQVLVRNMVPEFGGEKSHPIFDQFNGDPFSRTPMGVVVVSRTLGNKIEEVRVLSQVSSCGMDVSRIASPVNSLLLESGSHTCIGNPDTCRRVPAPCQA